VLTAGEANGVPWFAMPFVAGESLRARLAGQGALPIAEATKILRDDAQALAYAHESRRRLVDPRTYDLVLRARYAANSYTREGLDRALVLYDSALALDANLIEALIGKSYGYSALSDGFEHPSAVMPTAGALIERAMAIDSTRADVLAAAAAHAAAWSAEWPRAERLVAAARRRDRFSQRAMFSQYMVHMAHANVSDVLALLDTMVKVDPLDPLAPLNQIYLPVMMGDGAAAEVGDTTTMYKWLETGNRERSAWRLFLGLLGGKIGSHRGEPHYQALLTSYGITGLPPTR
jgi:hypothetical protein